MDKTTPGKIGRYEIIRVLAREGIGEMLLAEDQTLRRKVTIKRLIGTPVASDLARFQMEVKVAAFRHPNIPIVYEMGMHDDLPFIAMEFVEGESLESIIDSKRGLDLITKLKIIEQVCTALCHAHKNGIVYGDLTPENIIVQPNGVVKIVDVGIARAQHDDVSAGRVDTRDDLLFAGRVLFKLLTGRDPDTARDASDSCRTVNGPTRPRDAVFRILSPSLGQIVEQSLAKAPESRYQTGEQFAEALHKVINDLSDSLFSELLKDAERLTAERCFEPALERFDEAIRLFPSNAAIRKRRKSVRERHEQSRRGERIRECLRRSGDALLSGNVDESLAHLKDAANLDPDSEDIKARIRSVEEEKGRLENCIRALEEAERAKALGDFAGALRLTTKALQEDPTNQELLTLNAALAGQMEMEVQRGMLLDLLERAERDLAAGNYHAAVNSLNDAIAIDPLNQKADKLRWELEKARGREQRRAFLEDIQQRIGDLFKKDGFGEASGLVNRALDMFPDEVLLHRLKAEVDAEERRYDVRQVVDLVIAEAEELFERSPLEAMSVLETALDNMPGEARLIAHERALRQQMESRKSEHSTRAQSDNAWMSSSFLDRRRH
jgi:eukaryotic-like serine/threonine-protein kinase